MGSLRPAAAIALILALAACHKSSSPTAPTLAAAGNARASVSFKVATWNIRSGMGINGFTTTSWRSDTVNCTNPAQPMNAWGVGLPQAELATIRSDPGIVAMAIQEAWNCGSPTNVNAVLGFRSASAERDGTALLARYGFASAVQYHQLNRGAWLVSGDVCLDPACATTIPMAAAHWDGGVADSGPTQAQQTVDFMAARPAPHLFMGDLNVFRIDPWNPAVPCTGGDNPARLAAINLVEAAGYTDAWKATQNGEGWTGMATRNGCGVPNGNLFKRIDYVYAKGLRVVSTTRFARAAPGADSASDHVGLIAELLR
jgi:endonuclease/exonuclease/phosphatase family metal-dependent hydrolase